MVNKKLTHIICSVVVLSLFLISCEVNQTKSSGGSSSNSGTPSQEQPTHGQVTVNLLQQSVFSGTSLNSTYWNYLENYCKAGPTQLIMVDLDYLPTVMRQAGFPGSDNQLYYATASTYAGLNWYPGDDSESQYLSNHRQEIEDMWVHYVQKVIQVMQSAPQTTAVVITNDGPDRLGARLGPAIYNDMGAVITRVQLGDIIP
jgi:hypothetical protein